MVLGCAVIIGSENAISWLFVRSSMTLLIALRSVECLRGETHSYRNHKFTLNTEQEGWLARFSSFSIGLI